MKYANGKDVEKVRQYNKEYYKRNRERLLNYNKKYREENKEYYKKHSQEYYKTHAKERSKYYQEKVKKNKISTYKQVETHITKLLSKNKELTNHEIWNEIFPHLGGKIGLTPSKLVGRLRAHPDVINEDGKWMLREFS